MKKQWAELLLTLILGIGAPWLILGTGAALLQRQEPTQETIVLNQPASHRIQVLTENGEQQLQLEEYLTGVLLRELPASFAMEAKKAQAIVARTYAMRVTAGSKHDGCVCTDSGCCQGYWDPEDYLESGGKLSAVEEAREAAVQTVDTVLTYDGELIDATYFSSSGGRTEDAMAVWGADIPYLQSVESPGEESAAHHTDTVVFTPREFENALGRDLSGSAGSWFGETVLTQGGGVETMIIGGKSYQGTELRKLLGLRSTAFTVTATPDTITIVTKGFGHRVGMSQYGAQAMALDGSTCEEILEHYYQNCTIDDLDAVWGKPSD